MNPIIIALDVENAAQARELVKNLGDAGSFYKVGMELYAAAGKIGRASCRERVSIDV